MNKGDLCNIIRKCYPKAFGIRKMLQRLKIKRLNNQLLSKDIIKKCEEDESFKKSIVDKYLNKERSRSLKPITDEMETMIKNVSHYRDIEDKDSLRTDMIFHRLAYGFLPSEYASFKLEEKTKEEIAEFVSDIDTFKFGYSVNDITELQYIVNKADSYKQFTKYFKRDVLIFDKHTKWDDFKSFVEKHRIFIKKKINSAQGNNIELIKVDEIENIEEYFNKNKNISKFLLEELVIQSEEMAKFNSSSVNTIRCMTMVMKDGSIEVPYCFMRTGRNGSFVDNGGAGGIIIGVDEKTGIINTDGFDEYKNVYTEHPDTKVKFKGSQIPKWNDMLELCKSIAKEVNDIGFLSWDMSYTAKGWVVIEVNGIGQLIGPQIVMQRGIKSEIDELIKRMKLVI
ncbi:sugar-transfer associated ATP-grasp domain-containing protein [uncultured Parvimonas sp.]|uniref:sugar-transfer associated ATP-grasp domain-containing protein n=1 Tax=uncultured Parvimonas sp. TaxID=747372 RepID=UPI0025942012|nr:sugar-transfer associated ATP-grasp domain-containing protein [uncultured Parvimonas sp.]